MPFGFLLHICSKIPYFHIVPVLSASLVCEGRRAGDLSGPRPFAVNSRSLRALCILTRSPNRNGPGRATFPENSEQGNTKHEDGMKIGQVKGFICLIILIVVSKPQFHFMGDLGPPHHFSLRLILVTAHSNTIWNMRRAPVISNSIWFGLGHGSHGPSSTVPRR